MKRLVFSIVAITFLKFCACRSRDRCEEKFRVQYNIKNYEQNHNRHEGPLLLLIKSLEEDDELNDNFKLIAHALKFKVLEVDHFCTNSLLATSIVANYFENVINLKVKNRYADTHLPERLAYAGYLNVHEQQCTSIKVNYCNSSTINAEEPGTSDILNCSFVDVCRPTNYTTIKVVSKHLQKYKDLMSLLEVLDENYNPMTKDYWLQYVTENQYKNRVVICAENYYESNYKLQYKMVKDCNLSNFNRNNILGIIAPRPMDLMFRLSVPSIFYDIPEILPEYEYEYPNSAVVHGNYYKHLTKAAVKLIELAKWIRVGIISDISAYSSNFEVILTSALHEKNIAYNVKQCYDITCDFRQAMIDFYEVKARIIIVNVDEQYAPALVKTADELGLNAQHGYMWIWRGWPFKNDRGASRMGEVYSLSLLETYSYNNSADYHSISNTNIHKAFSAFNKALYNYNNDFDIYMENRSAKYSEIIAKIRNKLDNHKSNSVVYLRKITSEKAEIMYTFEITDNEVTRHEIHKAVTFSDIPSTASCVVRSNKFERTCDDYNLLILILVIFTFLILIMLIHMFFTSVIKQKQSYNSF